MMKIINNQHMAGSAAVKLLLSIMAITIVGGLIYGTYTWQHQKVDKLNQQVSQLNTDLAAAKKLQATQVVESEYDSSKGVKIKVYTPLSKSSLINPVVIMGEVPGNWSFEASFPVKLLDAKGNVVAQASAQLLGDWMTDKLVPFTVKLPFTNAPSGDGTLLLQKDNPSDLEVSDDSVSIPLRL